ncbi:MAG: class I SAM-dependent rRNA methyltransferase [Treponema sp.]
MNNFARVFLNAKEEREVLQGFPWVFDNEISHIKYREGENSAWQQKTLPESGVKDGSAVEVFTKAGGFIGTGIINAKSKIAVRLIGSEHADKIFSDVKSYWEKRIADAVNIRRARYGGGVSCRLVFADADFIPGFICERYCTASGSVILVVQFLALACEVFKKELLGALTKYAKPVGIYERSDADVRLKEGLAETKGWLSAPQNNPETLIIIEENGVKLHVDIADGQKTGYFLDQKENRAAAASFCRGKRVLDAFSHSGAFGLNAAKLGAREVISADISPDAVALIEKNIALNGFAQTMKAVCADAFDLLKKYETDGEKFDVIILDPPAFTKSARAVQKAYGGYKEINLRAMRLLNAGGILITCSCSHFFDAAQFYDMLAHAAKDSRRRAQILEKRGAAPDHPVLLGYPKSEYLKCAICRVM